MRQQVSLITHQRYCNAAFIFICTGQSKAGEEKLRYQTSLETGHEKPNFLIAVGLIVATMALGFAAVGHLPSREAASPAQGAELTGTGARRVYCFIGMKGEPPGSLY
jgi:hypothetical protein